MLLTILALLCAGCYTTNHVTMKASKHYEYNKDGSGGQVDGNSAYFLLIPLTIPYDMIMAPIRGIAWIKLAQNQGDGSGSK